MVPRNLLEKCLVSDWTGLSDEKRNLRGLVEIVLTSEQRRRVQQFSKDATSRPNINRTRILTRTVQNIGRFVPFRTYIDTEIRLLSIRSALTEVRYYKSAVCC